jgi:ABC-type cobalamin/Fe3+-siderophores transport system ATPase subunit
MLEAREIQFAYDVEPVLVGVNVSMEAGQTVAVIGPNGSGKSTLLRLLLGDLRSRGEINWDGKPISQWSPRQLARKVAYLPQNPSFDPADRVADVLRLGRAPYAGPFGIENTDDGRVISEVADRLELTGLLARRMDQLSGGQRQRVFVGRCLVQQPRALLLDEPDTHLDLRYRAALCRLLRGIAADQKIAILAAVHDLNVAAALADSCILLSAGRVAAAGPSDQVLVPAILEPVFQTPIRRMTSQSGGILVVAEI